ncbi:MAG: Ig-like domain-containing protein [Anaerocolumna sp.]
MTNNFLNIESVSDEVQDKVKQALKFRTGNFVWRIKFSSLLNPATVNNRNLYVTSISQMPLKTRISYDSINKYIEIEPLEPYSENQSYILTITQNVKSVGGKSLKKNVQIQFKI